MGVAKPRGAPTAPGPSIRHFFRALFFSHFVHLFRCMKLQLSDDSDSAAFSLVGKIIAGVGGAVLIVGVGTGISTLRWRKQCVSTDAEVVDQQTTVFVDQFGREKGFSCCPLLQFRPLDGSPPVRFRGNTRSQTVLEKGDLVPVLYLPSKPQSACEDNFSGLWGPTVVLGGVGLFLGVFGGLFWLVGSQAQHQE